MTAESKQQITQLKALVPKAKQKSTGFPGTV
jgi:hypothetical protein